MQEAAQPTVEAPSRNAAALCIVGAHDEADHLAALAFARVLPAADFHAQVLGHPVLAGEIVDRVAESGAGIVCISAVPPQAAIQAGYLVKRLKARLPALKILVVLWTSEDIARARARLGETGADKIVSGFTEAIAQLRELAAG
jgi:methylmalonyl-CoA mutase cobalamin-binding subunit